MRVAPYLGSEVWEPPGCGRKPSLIASLFPNITQEVHHYLFLFITKLHTGTLVKIGIVIQLKKGRQNIKKKERERQRERNL